MAAGSDSHPVRPLIVTLQHGHQDPNPNLLAQSPAKVDVRRQVAPERDGADLGGVGDSEGLEDAPGHAAEDLGGEQRLDVLGGEED